MAFTKTLQGFIAQVEYLADIRGQVSASAQARHPEADVIVTCNDARRDLLVKLVRLGFSELLVATDPAALSLTAAATGEHYSVEESPEGAISVRGVDVLQRGEWKTLRRATHEQRRTLTVQGRKDGYPSHWYELSAGSVNGDTFVPGEIAIYPLPTVAAQHRIWYLPDIVPISEDDDLFFYADASWYSWHVARTAWLIAKIRDNDAKKRAEGLETMMREAVEDMESMIIERQDDDPITVVRDDDYNG